MSILAQYGILKFYERAEYVHHEITENQQVLAVFKTNKIPSFQFMSTSSATTALVTLIKYGSGETIEQQTISTVAITGGVRVVFKSETIDGANVDGWYQIRVIVGIYTYTSDVFMWNSKDTELRNALKINVSTYDFAIGRLQEYRFVTTDYEQECYLKVKEYDGIELQNEEDANEENGQILPYYSGFSRMRQFTIEAHESIYEYLVGIRVMEINGEVTFSYRGISYSARDISVEVKEKSGNFDIVYITLKFVANNDIITPINE